MSPEVEVGFLLHFREWTGTSRARAEAGTVRELIAKLERTYPLAGKILAGPRPRPWTRILLNGRDVMLLDGLDTRLKAGDRVALAYPWMESG